MCAHLLEWLTGTDSHVLVSFDDENPEAITHGRASSGRSPEPIPPHGDVWSSILPATSFHLLLL
jgi:hypothetical protein